MINNLAIQQLNQQKQYQNVPVNGTANELASQAQVDDRSQSSGQSNPLQNNPEPLNNASASRMTKKRKIIIIASVSLAVLIVLGTVLGVVLSQKEESSSRIKIPATYVKYEQVINSGQQNNIVKLVHVPKAELTYQYKLTNKQQLQFQEKPSEITSNSVVNEIGLLCADVTESHFKMYLYIKKTRIYSNNQLITEFEGFPGILDKPEEKKVRRNLEQPEPSPFDPQSSKFQEQLLNEYNQLNQHEIEILKEHGIQPGQFNQSRFPIIEFVLQKDGTVESVEVPINLRHDLNQLYINIIQQLAPKVSSDIYNITHHNNNGKRILTQKKRTLIEKTLSGNEVQTEYQADIIENKQASLTSSYQVDKTNSNDTEEISTYNQQQLIEAGGLVQSSVNSNFKMQDNSDDKSYFKKILLEQNVVISFVSQNEEVSDEFFKKLTNTHSSMSLFKLSWDDAILLHQKVYKDQGLTHIPENVLDLNKRLLEVKQEEGKPMSEIVKQKIFRKNLNAIELGADIQTSCNQANSVNKEDVCKVALFAIFNENNIQVVQKEVKFNATKLVKYYQFIVSLLDKKVGAVNDLLNNKLQSIRKALKILIDRTEEFLDMKQNPVLKELYGVLANDELQLVDQFNQFIELLLQMTSNIRGFFQDPLNNLKERSLTFLQDKDISVDTYVGKLKEFVGKKLNDLLKVVQASNEGNINLEVIGKIKVFLENIDVIAKELVDQQVQQYSEQLMSFIQEQSSKFLDLKNILATVEENIDVSLIPFNKQIKEFLVSDGITSFVQKTLDSVLLKISDQKNIQQALSANILKQFDGVKQQIVEKLQQLSQIPNLPKEIAGQNQALQIVQDVQSVKESIKSDILNGINEFKGELSDLVNSLKSQLTTDLKQTIVEYAEAVILLPTRWIKIEWDRATETYKKAKVIYEKVELNLVQWSTEFSQSSNIIWEDIKGVYKDMKELIRNPTLPQTDGYISQSTMYDDIENIFTQVSSLMHTNLNEVSENGQAIMDQITRLNQLPEKVMTFVKDLKELGLKTFDTFSKVDFQTQYFTSEFQALKEHIQRQFGQAKDKFAGQGGRVLQEQQASFLDNLKTQSQAVFLKIMSLDQTLKEQGIDVKKIFFDKMYELASTMEFQKNLSLPELSVPLTFTQNFPTPIGLAVKLQVKLEWSSQIGFNVDYKKAVLNLIATLNSKIVISGSFSGSAYVAEAGGYVQGTVLDGTLTSNTLLNVLSRFQGRTSLTARFNPFSVKMGIYYSTVFSKESLQCITESGLLSDIQDGDGKTLRLLLQDEQVLRQLLDFQSGVSWVKSSVSSVIASIQNFVDKVTQKLKDALKTTQDTLNSLEQQLAQALKDEQEKVSVAFQNFNDGKVKAAAQKAKDYTLKIKQQVQDAAKQSAEAAKKYAEGTFQALKDCGSQKGCGIDLKNVTSALKCLQGTVFSPKKVDIIEPFEYKTEATAEYSLLDKEIKGY